MRTFAQGRKKDPRMERRDHKRTTKDVRLTRAQEEKGRAKRNSFDVAFMALSSTSPRLPLSYGLYWLVWLSFQGDTARPLGFILTLSPSPSLTDNLRRRWIIFSCCCTAIWREETFSRGTSARQQNKCSHRESLQSVQNGKCIGGGSSQAFNNHRQRKEGENVTLTTRGQTIIIIASKLKAPVFVSREQTARS